MSKPLFPKFVSPPRPDGALVNIKSMKESKYFKLEELLKSDTALAAQIENLPSWSDVENLLDLAVFVLDPIREAWGQPLIVTSGYRSTRLNVAVGGVPTSAHVEGCAVDITLCSWSTRKISELYNLIAKMVDDGFIYVDQVIYYRKKKIIHISNDLPCRKQFIVK